MDDIENSEIDEVGDNTPLPELTLFDLLDPTETSKEQQIKAAENNCDSTEDNQDKSVSFSSANAFLNTPGPKKAPIVRILENKRLTAPSPMGAPLKNMLGGSARVVTTPTKTTQPIDVNILNQLQTKPFKAFANAPVKIGSTTIAAPTASGSVSGQPSPTPKNLSGVTMTQIKTTGGQVLFIQKSLPVTGATSKLSPRLVSQLPTCSGIRQAIVSKSVTLSGTGQIKSSISSAPVTVRGLTPIGTPKPATQTLTNSKTTTAEQSTMLLKNPPSAEVASMSAPLPSKMPIQVRTADGKLIKFNQAAPMLLNTRPTTVAIRAGISTAPTNTNDGNKIINKSAAQVIIKGPLKPLTAGASVRPVNTSSSNIAASVTTVASIPTGKMLVQSSTGKQIVVASKNIIKLSPKPIASTIANTNATSSGLHSIQLSGKSGVQYMRVLPNNNNETTTSTLNSNTSTSVPVSNTSKIIMKTMGSIVPLPSMQTLVPRRAPGAGSNTVQAKTPNTNSSLEATRKHRLSDINVHIKHLTIDNSSDVGGPEAKKARYLIAMPQTSTTSAALPANLKPKATKHMLIEARPSQLQRVSVQGTNNNVSSSSISTGNTRKVYNLVTKNDVKYVICNKGGEGKPRTVFNTTMRRGYTLADTKLRRPITLTPQQLRIKQMKLQQQRQVVAQAKFRQQQLQKQHSPQPKPPQQKLPILQSSSSQVNKLAVPSKPLFDILKPPPTPAIAAAASLDVLGGSRRKHCNCSKSQCLKLYCDCFANGEFCQDCTCKDCFNNLDYEVKRERAIRSCLERNPSAFKPKITAPNSGDMRLHNKGCNCKRSGCLKNYCECYEAKIPCSTMCKCVGCRNMEDRPDVDMDSMDSLADVKLQAKELNGTYSQENRSNVYLTDDVIEATIMCMISRIVMHEKQSMRTDSTEREVIEELGESLNQIIAFAKEKNDTVNMDDHKTTV